MDTLCLDKTGTITSGEMEVSSVAAAPGFSPGDVEAAMAAIAAANAQDANETALALLRHARDVGVTPGETARAVPFDSARKYSGCVTADGRALVMGAAAFVLGRDRAREADALARRLRRHGSACWWWARPRGLTRRTPFSATSA